MKEGVEVSFNASIQPVQDREESNTLSVMNCTRLKLISFLNNPCHILSVGRDITFLGHTRGRVTVFFPGNWGRAEKIHLGKNIVAALPPPP